MYIGPTVFNIYKPIDKSSHDIVRYFKKNLPTGYGKIGHFGTLDPFAEGILMIGVNGAQRLNNYVHDFLPKTYQAVGILGLETPTGDLTVQPSQVDQSEYLNTQIKNLTKEFIEEKIKEKFLGEYWQAPHVFSAAKYEGKPLHEWAREGIAIKKEAKKRFIYSLKVIEYNFPELQIEAKVSSGTYIRTLFSDIANFIGTLGALKKLVRTEIGKIKSDDSLDIKNWPVKNQAWDIGMYAINLEQLLPFESVVIIDNQIDDFKNGRAFKVNQPSNDNPIWIKEKQRVVGLGYIRDGLLQPKVNFNCLVS